MPPTPAETSGLRAGDVDREAVVARLGDHMSAGRLDAAEFEDRVARALRARTFSELDALLGDLPAGAGGGAPRAKQLTERGRGIRPSPPGVAAAARLAPWAPWAPWAVTGVVCLIVWAAVALGSGTAGYFWPMWVIGPWGVMLATGRRGCRGRLRRPV